MLVAATFSAGYEVYSPINPLETNRVFLTNGVGSETPTPTMCDGPAQVTGADGNTYFMGGLDRTAVYWIGVQNTEPNAVAFDISF